MLHTHIIQRHILYFHRCKLSSLSWYLWLSFIVVSVSSLYSWFVRLSCESRTVGVCSGALAGRERNPRRPLSSTSPARRRSFPSGEAKSPRIGVSEWRQFRFVKRQTDPFLLPPFSMCALEFVFPSFCSCRHSPPYLLTIGIFLTENVILPFCVCPDCLFSFFQIRMQGNITN